MRRFDFEEAETARVEFPRYFVRNIAEDHGFPRFGEIALSRDAAARGRWSLRFTLDGGSLSVQTPSGVLPILPLADYLVTTRVRTIGLDHSRARLVAWAFDAGGNPIPESRQESEPYIGTGGWDTLAVHVEGRHPDAAYLVVELQVLQPLQIQEADTDRPQLEDVAGSAWFDDVCIWHQPRLTLALDAPGRVVVRPSRPRLSIQIRDVAGEALTARLRVFDLAGTTVFEEHFPAPRGRQPLTRELPVTACGWYRAELVVAGPQRQAGRETIDFAVIPALAAATGRNALTISLPAPEIGRLGFVPDLARMLAVGGVIVPIWNDAMPHQAPPPWHGELREAVERLLADGRDVSFALDGVPRALAATLGADSSEVLEVIGRDPEVWKDDLEEILINFGLRVRRWQLGSAVEPDAFWKRDLDTRIASAYASLSHFIPTPTIVVPFAADQEIPPPAAHEGISVLVPPEIMPDTLPRLARGWSSTDRDVTLVLEPLPEYGYAPRERVVDLLLRGLYGWRSGADRVTIAAPWRWIGDAPTDTSPEPAFVAWRGLARALEGRRFAGELALADDVHCWLMEGALAGNDALVAWRDQRGGDEPLSSYLALGSGEIRLGDPFGNVEILVPKDGLHRVPIGDMPVVVEGIDLQLAQFRAGIALEPSFLPAMHRMHDLRLLIRNPWPIGISGSIRLRDVDQLEFAPRRHDFLIPPGGEVRLPLTVVVDRSIVAGPKRLEADVRLQGEGEYLLRVHAGLEVGWKGVDLAVTWRATRNAETGRLELVVTESVSNGSEEVIHLDAFLLAPGAAQSRRVIGPLAPGGTAVRTFRLPNAIALSGRTLRAGISDRDGITQLNRLIRVPDLSGFDPAPLQAGVPDGG